MFGNRDAAYFEWHDDSPFFCCRIDVLASGLFSFLYLENTPNVKFKFDVAIIAKNERGDYCRLIHDKRYFRRYVWCEVPSSKDVRKKADKLKKLGYWSDVREVYKKLKNHYLSIQDNNHPSFTVYVEAVNRVYDQI